MNEFTQGRKMNKFCPAQKIHKSIFVVVVEFLYILVNEASMILVVRLINLKNCELEKIHIAWVEN